MLAKNNLLKYLNLFHYRVLVLDLLTKIQLLYNSITLHYYTLINNRVHKF